MSISISVDPCNPGQFFACCGLLELADRLWGGVVGKFSQDSATFHLRAAHESIEISAEQLFGSLAGCTLSNTMTAEQVARLDALRSMSAKIRAQTPGQDDAKKALEALRRESPLVLHAPFHLRLDWFTDDRAGGSRFKTWAGQQSVIDIALAMKGAIEAPAGRDQTPKEWFRHSVSGCGLPFNFDSDLGAQGSALDVGFSFDPLASSAATRIESSARPFLELLAFVGLQRFRPLQLKNDNRFLYCAWTHSLPPSVAVAVACGLLPVPDAARFEFRLLYRTKYLKSFLPAIPFSGESNE